MHFIYNASLAFDQESDCMPTASCTGVREMWRSGFLWDEGNLISFFYLAMFEKTKYFLFLELRKYLLSFLTCLHHLWKSTASFFRISVHHFQNVNRPVGPESLTVKWRKHYWVALVFLWYMEENVYRQNSFLREQGASYRCLPLLYLPPALPEEMPQWRGQHLTKL